MSNIILVYLEQREGFIKKGSFEAVSKAIEIAPLLGAEVNALVIGDSINNSDSLKKYGLNKVTFYKNSELQNYSSSAYAKIIADAVKSVNANYLIMSNTALGKDLAPLVSVALNAGLVVDAVSLEIENGDLTITRPIYAGKALESVSITTNIKVVSLRPNVFKAIENEVPEIEISTIEVTDPDLSNRVVELKKSEGKLDVAEADIIVSGGRGLKGPEHFGLIENLAKSLNAAVGASRAVVDAGWRPHREQVGQTGKTVTPTLYIACGISGAIQHLAGMSSSKYIVAINKDKDAPIFSVADYGIAGDLFEILPVLTEEIKKVKA
ncbi:MAG: electron transfer flavoprotein subunit alpha/FixB family protein [Ignavibacteria bacterium]|jgi:electron transfer flavoprotein alpha subunit|nr:electron transfer flavoprotein subunit alpha/FixB family protein [Ignavibacteria bacterium]